VPTVPDLLGDDAVVTFRRGPTTSAMVRTASTPYPGEIATRDDGIVTAADTTPDLRDVRAL